MSKKRYDFREHRLADCTEAEAVEALAARNLLTADGGIKWYTPVKEAHAAMDEYKAARAKAEQLRALVDETARTGVQQ